MDQVFIDWLLDSAIPSIRYLTLHKLLGRPETDPQVQAAQAAMLMDGPIPEILSRQADSGAWENERNYYSPKYVSTHWSLMLLAELGTSPDNPRLQRGADYMLRVRHRGILDQLKKGSYGMACFWGNMLRYVAQAGYADDPRTQPVIDFLVRDIQTEHCHCDINGDLPCAWGVARALWGLASLSSDQRTPAVESAIQSGLEFLLASADQLVNADYPTPTNINSRWFGLNFPLFYQVDILFTLRVAAELDALDRPGVKHALDWLLEKRQANGYWRGASPYGARTYKSLGGAPETSRWVSLHAAIILEQADMLN